MAPAPRTPPSSSSVNVPSSTSSANERTPLLGRSPSAAASITSFTLDDIDSRFKRWKQAVAAKIGKGKQRAPEEPSLLISVFEPSESASAREKAVRSKRASAAMVRSESDINEDVAAVREAIQAGVLPKMIQTGSSGSYFARRRDGSLSGVFKPSDEEPYGNLNAMSEAGASLLDDRLQLGMVPKTKLVKLSSPSFHYHYKDRIAYEHHGAELPEKIGSFQSFLHGYVMASTFLRQHPLPSRPRSILERDLIAEQRAHRKARKQYKARLRKCGVKLQYLLLCRQGFEDIQYDSREDETVEDPRHVEQGAMEEDDFLWTPESLKAFRLELEKLVVFDYLCRNTDRGLDNFMVQYNRDADSNTIKLGAIDNSLAWPIKHPDGIRDYPYGWLYLPSDLIGGPFSRVTRDLFLPLLSSSKWWYETEQALLQLFKQDEHFNPKLFESQMAVWKGQGWNLVQCLRREDEGPIELCARPKKVVHKSEQIMTETAAHNMTGAKLALSPYLHEIFNDPVASVNGTSGAQAYVPAQPVAIGGGDAPSPAPIGDTLQPRSLPETSGILAPQNPPRSGTSNSTTRSAAPTSLGIEVLESLNRSVKGSKRPSLSKAFSGPDLFAQGSDQRKLTLEEQRTQQRETRQERGKLDPSRSNDCKLRESDEEEEEEAEGAASILAQARMSSSDYFTYGVGRHRARDGQGMPSIDAALAAASATASQGTGVLSAPPKRVQRPSRRRPRNWSVTSFGTRYRDEETEGDFDEETPMITPAKEEKLIKVIIEKLVDDKSLPWQAWLRA